MSYPLRLSNNPAMEQLPADMLTEDDFEEIDTLIEEDENQLAFDLQAVAAS